MERKRFLLCVMLVLAGIAAACLTAPAEETPTLLTIYDGPQTMTSSAAAAVSVNGQELFVYDVMVNHEHIWNANTQPTTTPMTYFDFEGTASIQIKMPGLERDVESAEVLPRSAGILPR